MLTILYEDDALLFINKPAGLVVQRVFDEESVVQLTCEGPWIVELVK